MRSSNPVFRTLERSEAYEGSEVATYRGIVGKTGLLLMLAVASGYIGMTYFQDMVMTLLFPAIILAFISVIISTRSQRLAMPFAIIYALSEGVFLGLITVLINSYIPGVALTALIGTASIFTVMLFLYSSRTIRVTNRFRRIMYSVLLGFVVFFIFFGILSLFTNIYIDTSIALILSAVFIVFGALMLTLDFDRAEMIVSSGAEKSYEWTVAVGLMVTIVWIYVELLRFLMIMYSRRN